MTAKYIIDIEKCIKKTGERLGEGDFSVVEKAILLPNAPQNKGHIETPCAIKYFRQSSDSEAVENLRNELNLQISLQHPSILQAYGYSIPIMGQGDFCLVLEYAPNKTLKEALQAEDKQISFDGWTQTKKAISIFGIAAGMLYMHQHNIMHRDLKSANILLDEHFYPKISDFAVAKSNKEGIEQMLQQTPTGTPAYMAPEILQQEPYNNKVDVFSFAIILYEIFTCKVPSEDPQNKNKFQLASFIMGKRPTLNDRFPDFFKQLIEDCWAHDPNKRPSFAQILIRLKQAFEDEEIFDDDTYDRAEIKDYLEMVLADLKLEDPDGSSSTKK